MKLPIAIFTSPIFAKNLSHTDFAAMGYFNNLSTFLMPILALSFYSFYMTGYQSRTKEENNTILQTLVSFLLVIDVFIVTIAFIGLKYYLEISGSEFNAYPLGIIVFLTAMFNMGFGFWGIKLRFEGKSFKYFILRTSMMLFSVGLGLLLVVRFQMGATGRLIPNMIFLIGLFAVFFLLIVKRFKIDLDILKQAWLFCYPLLISALLVFPINYLDKILLERIHNSIEFGLYNIAGAIAGYFGMAASAVLQTFQPDIFKYVDKRNKRSLIQIFIVIVTVFIIGGGIFYSFSDYAVDYLTAGRYTDATKYISLFIIIVCLQPITFFLGNIIIALKLTKLGLLNTIFLASFSILIYSYLINNYEYYGALYAKITILSLSAVIVIIEVFNRNSKFISKFKVKES